MTTIEDIKRVLWAGADTFRGVIDAANYKEYVLSMLFIKYLDDKYDEELEKLRVKYDGNETRIERAKRNLDFELKDEIRFRHLYENRNDSDIGVKINAALQGIEDLNVALRGIFRSIDFNSESVFGNPQQKNAKLRLLLEDFSGLDLHPSHIEHGVGETPADVIGDAYEYMIGEFASRAGQKAGAFFTPMMVSELMAQLVEPKPKETIYDPTCGSASLLIRAAKQTGDKEQAIYGQEVNGSTYAMARMNLFIHGIQNVNIAWGDSLANPQHLGEDGGLKKFDVIVANMPFSLDKWSEGFNVQTADGNDKKEKKFKMEAKDDPFRRFEMGVPPASKGDWAFLLHMIASLAEGGRMAAVVPHGVLFRGASEGKIRQAVIEKNLLDAVIGLPANLFFGTTIPACIMVFRKDRTTTDVFFIDASGKDADGNFRYEKDKNQNRLGKKNIEDILAAYRSRQDVDKFAHCATLEEIRENGYNLNIPRYVNTFEEEELIDIQEVQTNIARIKSELNEVETQMSAYLRQLGLE